jgi:hypothetical protein
MSPFSVPDLSLTDAERKKFDQAVTTAGLDPAASWSNVIVFPAGGVLPPGFVSVLPVASLSAMKALVGISDDRVQGAGAGSVHRPAPAIAAGNPRLAALAPRDLAKTLTLQQHRDLKRTADTFVFGHSASVAGDSALVDVLSFPTTVNIVAAQSLTLTAGAVLRLEGNPWLLILGSLHIGPGAQIVSSADTVVNAQVAYSAN